MRARACVFVCALAMLTAKEVDADDHHVDVGGYLTVIYKFRVEQNGDGVHDPDVFRLGKAVVRFSGKVHKRIGYVIEVDPRSPSIQGVLRDGYLTLYVVPGHELRIGQQKTPFGYENWLSSASLYTITRSELSEGMGRGVTHRDIGIGLVGNVKLAHGLRLEDAVAVVNGAGFGVQADDTQLKNLWGRIGLRYKAGGVIIHGGVSGAVGDQMGEPDPGPPPEPAVRFAFRRIAGDLELDQRWLHVGVEGGIGWTIEPADTGEPDSDLAFVVLLAGKLAVGGQVVGPVVRYDVADADGFERITAGAYVGAPSASWRVIADYERFADDEGGTHDGRVSVAAIARF